VGISFNRIAESVNPGSETFELMVYDKIAMTDEEEDILVYTQEFEFPLFNDVKNGFYNYLFDAPVTVSDTFYVGIRLVVSNEVSIGFDRNNDAIDHLFFNGFNFWINAGTEIPGFAGAPMIRPIVGEATPVGLLDLTEAITVFTLYPNPTKDVLEIQVQNRVGDYQVVVADLSGRIIKKENSLPSSIDVSSFMPGMYLISILDDQGKQYHQKFIKN